MAALESFGPDLLAAYTGRDPTALDGIDCLYHSRQRWCAFTKSAPASLLPAYTAYVNSAMPWLEDRWDYVYMLERYCKAEWVAGNNERQEGQVGIYDLWMFSYCSASAAEATEVVTGTGGTAVSTGVLVTTMGGKGATTTGAPSSRPESVLNASSASTALTSTSGVNGKGEGVKRWMADAGVAAVVAGLML